MKKPSSEEGRQGSACFTIVRTDLMTRTLPKSQPAGAGEMTQWVRALAAPSEDLSSVCSPIPGGSQQSITPTPRDPVSSSDL